MGKKKDERKRREREARASAAGEVHATSADQAHDHADRKHGGATPFAGLAASLVKQLETPLGRQIISAGLMAAAGAIARQDAKATRPAPPTPPSTPTPPSPTPKESQASPESAAESPTPEAPEAPESPKVGPSTGPFAGKTAEPPRSDAAALPPEMAKMIDSVAVGLGRLFNGFGKPPGEGAPKDMPPKG